MSRCLIAVMFLLTLGSSQSLPCERCGLLRLGVSVQIQRHAFSTPTASVPWTLRPQPAVYTWSDYQTPPSWQYSNAYRLPSSAPYGQCPTCNGPSYRSPELPSRR